MKVNDSIDISQLEQLLISGDIRVLPCQPGGYLYILSEDECCVETQLRVVSVNFTTSDINIECIDAESAYLTIFTFDQISNSSKLYLDYEEALQHCKQVLDSQPPKIAE